jgi:hypothetical protein
MYFARMTVLTNVLPVHGSEWKAEAFPGNEDQSRRAQAF